VGFFVLLLFWLVFVLFLFLLFSQQKQEQHKKPQQKQELSCVCCENCLKLSSARSSGIKQSEGSAPEEKTLEKTAAVPHREQSAGPSWRHPGREEVTPLRSSCVGGHTYDEVPTRFQSLDSIAVGGCMRSRSCTIAFRIGLHDESMRLVDGGEIDAPVAPKRQYLQGFVFL